MPPRVSKFARCPPLSWRRQVIGVSERLRQWAPLSTPDKSGAWHGFYKSTRVFANATRRVLEGGASRYQKRIVSRGTIAIPSYTLDERVRELVRYTREGNDRRSLDTLRFRLKHATGCTEDGCVLAPSSSRDVLLCLLEHDHMDGVVKEGLVTHMKGAKREAELLKTRVLCCWHHFQRTRVQRRYKAASMQHSQYRRIVSDVKTRVGCQHPLHASMPYAEMVSCGEEMTGFFEVSHVHRGVGTRNLTEKQRVTQQMAHLESGQAVVHCCFCHNLYSLCESARLTDTAFTRHQYALLIRRHPAFVMHFDIATSGFDWDAARREHSTKVSIAKTYHPKRPSMFDEAAYIDADRRHVEEKSKRAKRRAVRVACAFDGFKSSL